MTSSRTRKPVEPVETVEYKDHSVITVPTTLRDRAMIITSDKGEGYDISALARAEEALAELSSDFRSWMESETECLEKARAHFAGFERDHARREALYRAAHDIRGQGRTFGYPLAGQVADGLCDLMDASDEIEGDVLALVDAHIDAIRIIVRDDIQGRGDDVARKLVEELSIARTAMMGARAPEKLNLGSHD